MYFSAAVLSAIAVVSGAVPPVKADLTTGRHLQVTEVARGKPSMTNCDYHTETGWDGAGPASWGNDGNYNNLFHTCSTTGSWWSVDLEAVYEINKVRLYNRQGERHRLSGAKVEVLLDGMQQANVTLGDMSSVSTYSVVFQGEKGNEVKISKDNQYLHLREVEVYGVPFNASAPTEPPTKPPTKSPTVSPTVSPISAPWDINFKNMTFDLAVNDEDEELVLEYDIGKRLYANNLYAKSCQDREVINVAYGNSNSTMDSDPGMSKLTVSYNFNKSTIATSNMWNGVSEQLELCHVVQLLLPRDGEETMVIAEDLRDLTLGVNMLANYSVGVNLTEQIVSDANATADLGSYAVAYRCTSSGDPVPEGTTLGPNDALYVCIRSTSPDEVEVETVNTMVISQDGEEKFIVLRDGGVPAVPTISSLEYNLGGSATHQVTTRVPSNIVTFAAGRSIEIAGTLTMQLAGGSSRRALREKEVEGRGLQGVVAGDEEQASFAFAVDLADDTPAAADAAGIQASSVGAAAMKLGSVLGALSVAAYAIMM